MEYYNKLLEYENNTKYPYNLNKNLESNVIFTKKEIELEYIKEYNIYKEKNKNGSNELEVINAKIYVYI
jgi:hypothetical protein